MTAPMVLEALAERKTQTRRIVNIDTLRVRPRHDVRSDLPWDHHAIAKGGRIHRATMTRHAAVSAATLGGQLGLKPGEFDFVCPYADATTVLKDGSWLLSPKPEQRLWVKERWARSELFTEPEEDAVAYAADRALHRVYDPTGRSPELGGPYHFGLLDDGRVKWGRALYMPRWAARAVLQVVQVRIERLQDITEQNILAEGVTVDRVSRWTGVPWGAMHTLHDAWRVLWDHINGPRGSYASNPWVWAITFRRLAAWETTEMVRSLEQEQQHGTR